MSLNNEAPLRSFLKRLRRGFRLLRWAFCTFLPTKAKNGRVLLVYDLKTQPFSVGDILVFQEAALIARSAKSLGKIDVAVVYEEDHPVVDDPAFAGIKRENFLFHLPSVLPAIQVNPFLGSAFLFDSHEALESFIADNQGVYYVWPDAKHYASRDYLFYHCFNELFFEHYDKHGTLPALRSRPAAQECARAFLNHHANGNVMGTVQLRRNPANPTRNSIYEAWIAFFIHCANNYPVTFLVICAPHEIDPRFRELSNVILAKDHHTSLELDLALIEAAAFHMGAASGPSTICWLNRKPYCIFGWAMNPATFRGLTVDEHRYRFYFSTEYQNWLIKKETPEVLISEFERMWPVIRSDVK